MNSQLEIFNEGTELIKASTYEKDGKMYLDLTVKKKYNPDICSQSYADKFRDKEFIMCIPKICLNNIYFNGLNKENREVITITMPSCTFDNYKNHPRPYVDLKASEIME